MDEEEEEREIMSGRSPALPPPLPLPLSLSPTK